MNLFNTQYMRNPTIGYMFIMDYVPKITISGLKMMVKVTEKWYKKNIFEIPPRLAFFRTYWFTS